MVQFDKSLHNEGLAAVDESGGATGPGSIARSKEREAALQVTVVGPDASTPFTGCTVVPCVSWAGRPCNSSCFGL